MLEHRFNVGEKTAKRDLARLTTLGLVEFVRAGNGGHYRPVRAFRPRATSQTVSAQAVHSTPILEQADVVTDNANHCE
jgi:predicted DNA-binding transcriptional regulator YafY